MGFQTVTSMKQIKLFLCALLLGFAAGGASIAAAAQYYPPTMANLTGMLFNFDVLDLSEKEAFDEFMKINFCDIYRKYSNNEFQWNEIHKAFLAHQDELKESGMTDYKIDTVFEVDGYDFSVQAFNINDDTAIKEVWALQMNERQRYYCRTDGKADKELRYLPNDVLLNIELPLNLYRIPINPNVAEKAMKRLHHNSRGETLIYATIFVHVETAKKVVVDEKEERRIRRRKNREPMNVYGYVERITFYADTSRRYPFKTLYYNY